jgi:hypothetical protein
MQTITSITPRDELVASGLYTYYLNERPAGVTEAWSVHRSPGGSYCARVERDARAAFGVTILLEVESQAPFAPESVRRFVVWQYNEQNIATQDARAEYVFDAQSVTVARAINGHALAEERITLPSGTVISPLMRVFLGPVILRVWRQGGGQPVPVLTPSLEKTLDPQTLLRPSLDQRQARFLGEEELSLTDRVCRARRFQYLSRHYDASSQFWLDERGVLLRYLFPQSPTQRWDTQLTVYQRFD